MTAAFDSNRTHVAVVLVLLVAVAVVFGQTIGHEFLRWDDDGYILRNPRVREGLSASNVLWAFTNFSMSNWHPLTWLSMMADVSLFGLWAGGHHLVSVAWHGTAAVMLYFALVRLSGDAPRAALVALLFALHPLHVESVAWSAERKDLICGFFWSLSLLAYAAYARAPSLVRYGGVFISLAAALMSKPMAVTLPAILVALDFWPLRRHLHTPLKRLIAEKLPLAALSLGSAAVTLVAQNSGGSTRSLEQVGLAERVQNVVVAYATYMVRTLLPTDLSFFYVYRPPAAATLVASALLLATGAAAAWRYRARAPWLAVGLLWFFVSLLPVIGIVRVGDQAWANRYAYLPQVGLFIALVWSLPVPARWPARGREWILAGTWAAAMTAAGVAAAVETSYWRSSETLFRRAIEVDPDNYVAYSQLAEQYVESRRTDEAVELARQAIRHAPPGAPVAAAAWVTQSRAFLEAGRYADAEQALDHAAAIDPRLPVIHYNRGTLELLRNNSELAVPHLERAIRLKPDYSEAHNNLGAALARLGRLDEALAAHRAALQADGSNLDALYNVGATLERMGRTKEAAQAFEQLALRAPRHVRARLRAARLAYARGDDTAGRRWVGEVLALEPGNIEARRLSSGVARGN